MGRTRLPRPSPLRTVSPSAATKGHRYQIQCRRPKSAHHPTYTGTYLGADGEWSLFELDDGVRLRVDEWSLVGLELA